jgi:hypothetical protein
MLHLKGNLFMRALNNSTALGYKPAFLFPMVSLAIQSQPQVVQAMKTDRVGRMKTAAQEITGTQYSMTITTQTFDWTTLQLLQGQLASTETTKTVLHRIYSQVPSSGAYEIADAGLPAAANPDVTVYVTERGPWGEGGLRKMVSAAPGAGEVQFNHTDKKLIFNAADKGAPFVYTRPTIYATVEAIGATLSPDYFGDMEAWFYTGSQSYYPDSTGYSGGLQAYFPKMTRAITSQSLDFGQSPVTGQLVYGLIAPDYQDLPFSIWNINTAVLPT